VVGYRVDAGVQGNGLKISIFFLLKHVHKRCTESTVLSSLSKKSYINITFGRLYRYRSYVYTLTMVCSLNEITPESQAVNEFYEIFKVPFFVLRILGFFPFGFIYRGRWYNLLCINLCLKPNIHLAISRWKESKNTKYEKSIFSAIQSH
jgi:hypothetical protein